MTLVIRFLLVASLLLTQDIHAFEYHYPRSSVDMQLRQVSPHVWFVQGATGVATDNQGCINPASIYTVFRASRMDRIKARRAGKGHSLGKRHNTEPVHS